MHQALGDPYDEKLVLGRLSAVVRGQKAQVASQL